MLSTMNKRQRSMRELVEGPAVLSVPEGGAYLGLGRSASFVAARKGVLPTIRIGERRLVVPAAALARLLAEAGRED